MQSRNNFSHSISMFQRVTLGLCLKAVLYLSTTAKGFSITSEVPSLIHFNPFIGHGAELRDLGRNLLLNMTDEEKEWVQDHSGQFEGDIVLTPEQEEVLGDQDRGGLLLAKRWPDGIIYYNIEDKYDSDELAEFAAAFADIEHLTCIKFQMVPTDHPHTHIRFSRLTGCWSYFGKTRQRVQRISIGDRCVAKGIIIHEIMHALGFMHEQSRPDRDQFVTINHEHIIEKYMHNFNTYGSSSSSLGNTDYDYCSIMHYNRLAFSKDGISATISLDESPQQSHCPGNRSHMTLLDVIEIRKFYGCPNPDFYSVCPQLTAYCDLKHAGYFIKDYCPESCRN